jgi:tRNA pseudouridine38-40 synthase
VANFKSDTKLPVEKLFNGINSILPDDIVIKKLEEVSGEFHAQRDVKSKIYVYRIRNQSIRPVLGQKYFWFIRFPLDIERMRKSAQYLIGTYDFSCFCATGSDVKTRVRTITSIAIEKGDDGLLEIIIESQGFLKYMVRNIVGTLVDIGWGKRDPEEMKEIIESRDRNIAGATAPACGLFLKEVKY